jgi:hypothetical protein
VSSRKPRISIRYCGAPGSLKEEDEKTIVSLQQRVFGSVYEPPNFLTGGSRNTKGRTWRSADCTNTQPIRAQRS